MISSSSPMLTIEGSVLVDCEVGMTTVRWPLHTCKSIGWCKGSDHSVLHGEQGGAAISLTATTEFVVPRSIPTAPVFTALAFWTVIEQTRG